MRGGGALSYELLRDISLSSSELWCVEECFFLFDEPLDELLDELEML